MPRIIVHTAQGSSTHELGPIPLTFGRDSACSVPLLIPEASRRHFQIEQAGSGYRVVDLESRNGTKVNGTAVTAQLLRHGDQIELGPVTITYDDPSSGSRPPELRSPDSSPDGRAKITGRSTGRARASAPSAAPYVAAGLAVALAIGLLIALGQFSNPDPAIEEGRRAFNAAVLLEEKDPPAAAAAYERIGVSAGEWYDRAQRRLEKLREELKRLPTPEEAALIGAYETWINEHPFEHDEIVRRGEELLARHPKGAVADAAKRHIDATKAARDKLKRREVDDEERAVNDLAARQDFGQAVERVNALVAKHGADLDLKDRLVRLHASLVEKGKIHAKEVDAEAGKLRAAGKTLEAKDLYLRLTSRLGGGKVPEFADQCRAATLNAEGLK